MKFLDEAKIFVQSGVGGDGALSFRREKNIPRGGPDGGDGGRGGHVRVVAKAGLNTLIDFRYRQHVRARPGEPGRGRNQTGADGDDVVIEVPPGTQILDGDRETPLHDLSLEGEQAILARGGEGGFGNARYRNATNRAPRRADPGRPGEGHWLWLRLKLIADAGLVGLPNVGKSTFLAAVTRARAKIADYPFTTLTPQLGVAAVDEKEFVLADIPGLIEGAHEGAGLGDRFLGHIERCRAILHLVDGTGDKVSEAYRTVRRELVAYGGGLDQKAEIVALNKCDSLDEATKAARQMELARTSGRDVLLLSGATGLGRDAALHRLYAEIRRSRPNHDDTARAAAGSRP